MLTASRLVGDPAEKLALGVTFGADIVDMESSFVAAFALERGIAFRCVRVVSDAVDRRLSPSLVKLIAGGNVRPLEVLKRPLLVPELVRLGRSTSRAARRLAEHLAASAAAQR